MGLHKDAAECFRAALSIDSCNAEAMLGLGDALRGMGNGDALREYSYARRSGSPCQRARAYAGLALALAEMSRYVDGAELACMAAAAAGPGAGAIRAELADHCSRWGDAMHERECDDGARRCYAMALSIYPLNAGGHIGNGSLLAGQRLFDGALGEYRAALYTDSRSIKALVGAGRALCELAKDRRYADDRRSGYREAEEKFDQAIKDDPGNYEARMGAGRALRKTAQLCRSRQEKTDCYRRAMEHYEALSNSGNALPPAYWKGVCMLHLGGKDAGDASGAMAEALAAATPRDSVDLNLCGRICDILGDYDTACRYYAGSLKGSHRYTGGFHKKFRSDRVHEPAAPPRPGAAPAEPATYVLDANMVIECALPHMTKLPPYVVPRFIKIRNEGRCSVPQASFDEAYGVLSSRDDLTNYGDLISWNCHVVQMPADHNAANHCMQKAREAMMTAWLYSSKKIKEKWRGGKFSPRTPYCGGPPTGKDVQILATAVHLKNQGGAEAEPCRIRLVTSDNDFLYFGRYIHEVLSIEVIEPVEAANLIERGLREDERALPH